MKNLSFPDEFDKNPNLVFQRRCVTAQLIQLPKTTEPLPVFDEFYALMDGFLRYPNPALGHRVQAIHSRLLAHRKCFGPERKRNAALIARRIVDRLAVLRLAA